MKILMLESFQEEANFLRSAIQHQSVSELKRGISTLLHGRWHRVSFSHNDEILQAFIVGNNYFSLFFSREDGKIMANLSYNQHGDMARGENVIIPFSTLPDAKKWAKNMFAINLEEGHIN